MIYKIVNKEKLNFFNPTYEYYIYETMVDFNLDFLKQFILQKENEIIFNYPAHTDGDTGLGNNSLTSRYPHFNLLQYKELDFLKQTIKKEHNNFTSQLFDNESGGLGYEYKVSENVYVQCWANVMRKGEKIQKHIHGNNNYGYLGGHICVYTKDTNTYYSNPYNRENFVSKNFDGKLTFFPDYLAHYTDEVKNDLRITVAFDMITEQAWKEDIKEDMKSHWEPLHK